ncbi:MAG: type II toxin-antitoxin system VapC family toxin [Candidatus Limnocylindrales bacterium]
MITAVDSNVLLDVFGADAVHGPASRDALRRCLAEGALIACDVVWAEVAASFPSAANAAEAFDRLGLSFSPVTPRVAADAGQAWRDHVKGSGRRGRVIADFLVAAHARAHADRFLTRDRGFYREAFKGLTILEP